MNTVNQYQNDTAEILKRCVKHLGPADGAFGTNANGRGYLIDPVCEGRDYPVYQIRECLPFDKIYETPRIARVYALPNETQIIYDGFTDLQDIIDLIPENVSI